MSPNPHSTRPELAFDATPAVRTDGPLASGDRLRPLALAALTLVLVGLCVALALPLLPALTWGVALAVVAWPLHVWLARHLDRPALAAFLTATVVAGAVAAAGLFVTLQLAREAANAAERTQDKSAGDTVRDAVAGVPWLDNTVAWMDRVGVDLDHQVRVLLGPYTQDAAGLAQGSLQAILQFAVALFVLYHLLKDRTPLLAAVARLLPMTRAESERVFARFTESVYANLYATIVTSIIDAVGGGLMFWLLGLPSPVLWGVAMFVLSILPLLGTWLIWLPAAAYLLATGRWVEALVLVAWGVATWVIVDNVIYVRVAGNTMHLHQVPTLIAFLGGLAVFGASGMVLGPAILAVTVAVLEVWRQRQNAPGVLAAG